MVKLMDKESGKFISAISEEHLNYLVSQLEEEGLDDQDYAITPITLALFEGQGADPILVSILKTALGDREEMTVYWENE